MGKLTVYGFEPSPPVRPVLFTLNALGLDYDFKEISILKKEHMTKEYLEKNPQNTVPTLEDDGQFIWDSHAISAYLVRKYAKNDDLYPKDFIRRAIVDQRLHFDTGVLYPRFRNITDALFGKNEIITPQEKIDAIYEAYNYLEVFLKNDYLAGETLTIADFSALSTVSTLQVFAPVDRIKTPNLQAWLSRMSKLPYYEKANAGLAKATEIIKAQLAGK